MKIDPTKLQTVTNFSKSLGYTRQHVYRLLNSGEINGLKIDGIQFIIIDEKATSFERKREKKSE